MQGEVVLEILDVEFWLKIVGFLVAFFVVLFQINKQHKNNLKTQRQNFKEKLKLQIFEEISERLNESGRKFVKLSSKISVIKSNTSVNELYNSHGLPSKMITDRVSEVQNRHFDFSQSLVEIIYILEKYFIADGILRVFCMALQSGMHDLDKEFEPLNGFLLKILPVDVPEEKQYSVGAKIIFPKNISNEDLKVLDRLSSEYHEKLFDIYSYLHDLQVELQNIFLGGIFESKVDPRKSNKDKYVVISHRSDRSMPQLEQYFMHETEWGRKWQEAKKLHSK